MHRLLERIRKICSDKKDRELEVEKLKVIVAKNDYPSEIIRKETEKFLKNRMNKNTEAPQVEANNKAVKYLVLPHVNNKVIDYGRRLKNFIETNFTNLELKVVFVASRTFLKNHNTPVLSKFHGGGNQF